MSAPSTSFAEIFNSGYWEGMQEITDGTLQTDDGKNFRIHRVVLSQSSSYFRALFSFHLNQETVVIPCIDSELFEIILIYIYTNKIALDEKNVYDLLMVLDYLLLDDLLKSCEAFAIQNMTSTNCLSLLTVASDCNRSAVFEKCYRYVLVHFEDILEASNGEFEILPLNILNQLLESNSLNVISEISVWKAIVSWTEAKGSTRLPHVPILLTFLRLEEETDEELVAEILSHSIVSSNPHIFGLMLSNDFSFHATCTPPSQHARLQPCYKNLLSSYRPRVPSRMYLIARHTLSPSLNGSEIFMSYDNELDYWRRIGEAVFFIDRMLQIGQRIYMFDRSSMGAIFDIVEEEWLRVREIPPRPSLDGWVIILGEQLYHIDQHSRIDHDSMNMIFSYDFERNSWELITHIRNNVIYGAVTFKDRIFIVGVSKIEPAHMVCLAYDPANETWTMLPSPNIFREKFSVVACHEKVFVISGVSNEEEYLKVVESYDPLQNTWMSLPDLPFQYLLARGVIVDDKVIVYENNGEDIWSPSRRYQKVDPPVYWDEGIHLWKIIDESSPWYHIERYTLLVLDDNILLKDLTAENRLLGTEWNQILPV